MINFTPQYNSLQKHQSVLKDKFSGKNNAENRKSLALPDLFTDLRAHVDLAQGLKKSQKRSKKSSKVVSKLNTQ